MISSTTLQTFASCSVLLALLAFPISLRAEEPNALKRDAAQKAQKAGNFKDAYAQFSALILDANDDPLLAPNDLEQGIQCLRNLNREDEVDDFREKAIAVQAKNWRVLQKAAETLTVGNHVGYIVAAVVGGLIIAGATWAVGWLLSHGKGGDTSTPAA